MICKIKSLITEKNIFQIGQISFFIGVFFIGSALPISIICFLISSLITLLKKKDLFFKDIWNYPFMICAVLMIISAFYNFLGSNFIGIEGIQTSTIWIDTLNWIPLFFLFWSFQPYIKSQEQKIIFAKVIIAGSIPILISCALQLWFGIYGPFQTFYDLIIWFQKPMNDSSSVSGLFSNPNYLASWLVIISPFSLYLSIKQKNYPKKLITLLILFLNIYFLSQANSRNAILGTFSSIIIIFGIKKSIIIIISLIAISIAIFSYSNLLFSNNDFIRNILPLDLIYKSTNLQDLPRFEVWQKGLTFIKERPIFGWGAGTFYLLFLSRGGSWNSQHTHNMPLDMAYKYGIFVSIILTLTITLILFKALKNSNFRENEITIDKCWCAASFAIIIFQMNDITYFDGKINLMIWILLSGLKSITPKKGGHIQIT